MTSCSASSSCERDVQALATRQTRPLACTLFAIASLSLLSGLSSASLAASLIGAIGLLAAAAIGARR
jgi:hypothetical protein